MKISARNPIHSSLHWYQAQSFQQWSSKRKSPPAKIKWLRFRHENHGLNPICHPQCLLQYYFFITARLYTLVHYCFDCAIPCYTTFQRNICLHEHIDLLYSNVVCQTYFWKINKNVLKEKKQEQEFSIQKHSLIHNLYNTRANCPWWAIHRRNSKCHYKAISIAHLSSTVFTALLQIKKRNKTVMKLIYSSKMDLYKGQVKTQMPEKEFPKSHPHMYAAAFVSL